MGIKEWWNDAAPSQRFAAKALADAVIMTCGGIATIAGEPGIGWSVALTGAADAVMRVHTAGGPEGKQYDDSFGLIGGAKRLATNYVECDHFIEI